MQNKNLIRAVLLLLVICSLSFVISDKVAAMGGPAPKAQQTGLLIDGFEDGNYTLNPAWWVFDQVSPEVISTIALTGGDRVVLRTAEKQALYIKGNSKLDWYAGGMGVYFAKPGQDLSVYRNLQMDIYGYGPGQGTLKIELFDDDNNNWEIEQNTMEAYVPMFDDRFSTEMRVDWIGWKRVVIPLTSFTVGNPGVGDGVWNPAQADGSGGLLQMQFICITSQKIGALQYVIDNIRLTK